MNKFYVYGFYEQGSDEPFYIGKGRGKRAQEHFQPWCIKQTTMFYSKLRALVSKNTPPTIQYFEVGLTEEAAFALEIKLIAWYGRRDIGTGCLTNHTDG